MRTISFRSRRWAAAWIQAAVVAGLPFIRVRGESALRFDVPSLKLYFFGSIIWISEAFLFLLVFLLVAVGVIFFTVLYGRIWCGWICPQTVLSDFSRRLDRIAAWFSGHRMVRTVVSHAFLLLFSTLVSATLIWYFVSPYEVLQDIMEGALGPWTFWSWIFFAALIYLNLAFVRQLFCGSVCPYARLQSAFFDDRTLTIAFDRSCQDECLGCEACVRACPAGIDIREGLQVECINCAECIDSCSLRTAGKGGRPLIGYEEDTGGDARRKGLRPRVIGLGALLGLLAALLTYQVAVRMPFDFRIMRDEDQPYHQVGIKDALMNAYSLVIENRELQPAAFELKVSGIKDAELVIARNPIPLPGNSMVRLRIYVFADRGNVNARVTRLHFTLRDASSAELWITQEAPFIYPERSDKGGEI